MPSSNGNTVSKEAGAGHVVAFADDHDRIRHVMLVTRLQRPYDGRPALPGGRRRPGETTSAAAARAFREETGIGIPVQVLQHLGTWDIPGCDDSTDVYTVLLPDMPDPQPGGTASYARWALLSGVRTTLLAQNHNDIVDAASAP
ncbi:NUDIX domain-containing protein [Amycolatopsis sp. NPDC004079]|uniref:NUDIX domain-containing protein n=1 Tax=Amycolatopsis sp. NPDC004079 TaxID=3154549 RepID=UPI0033AE4ECB